MRILYVLPAISHPAMRGELRHHHLLAGLARNHDVTLVAMTRIQPPEVVLDDLRRETRHLEVVSTVAHGDAEHDGGDRAVDGLGALGRRYAKRQKHRRALRRMRDVLARLRTRERFDLALAYGAELGDALQSLDGLPLVADICDAGSVRLKQELRFARRIEWPWRAWRWRQTARAEQWLLRRTPFSVFISERDRSAIEGSGRRSAVIPNGVDVDYWQPVGGYQPGRAVVFTGTMDYPPNADAAEFLLRDVLPLVRATAPDVRFIVAGRGPTDSLTRLAERTGSTVTGAVSDLRPYLQQASLFVAPLRFASGMQNKILEAMAMEMPVITTPVAAAGVQFEGAKAPVTVATDAAAFARSIASLLDTPHERARLGRESRAFVQRHFKWAQSARQLEEICVEAACA